MVRKVFVVGKRNSNTTTVLVLRLAKGPIAGPFTLRAVVSVN